MREMFKYVKMKIVQESENPRWLFRSYVGTEKELDGRVVVFKDGSLGNHQIKLPQYTNWFDVQPRLVSIVTPTHQ
jgi:hypothetical protein